MDPSLRALREAFGVALDELPLPLDRGFLAEVQRRLAALPNKRLRLLLLSNPIKKYHEDTFLRFFDALRLDVCDCVLFDDQRRSLRPTLEHVRYCSTLSEVAGRRYDYVVSFDSNQRLCEVARAVRAPPIHVGRVRGNLLAGRPPGEAPWSTLGASLNPRRLAARLAPVPVYGTLRHTQSRWDYVRGLGWQAARLRASIDFPPNTELSYARPARLHFPFLVLGGHDRDYAAVARSAAAFGEKTLVTLAAPEARVERLPREQRAGLEALRRDPRFLCLSWLREDLYLRLLLHSRVVVVPVRGGAPTDYTSISDALWYGKPVVTRRVRATAHLGDRVTFFDNEAELAAKLEQLRDEDYYEQVSARRQALARTQHSLIDLLCRLHADLE